jgi:hypothetical protein
MDNKDHATEVAKTPHKAIARTVTYMNITSLEVKHIQEVVDTTYADGSEEREREKKRERTRGRSSCTHYEKPGQSFPC